MTNGAEQNIARAVIASARSILFTSGAGMGVDSGLPDFRGIEGFWRAYPAYRTLGLRFEQMANPHWFAQDPELAWGFYGHRHALYKGTSPHDGYALLAKLASRLPTFAFTSNVDGQLQKAGFRDEAIVECHGAIGTLQCTTPCSDVLWDAGDLAIAIDQVTFRSVSALPRCARCGAIARPNVLMFGDGQWVSDRTEAQELRLAQWLRGMALDGLVVIECGAGTAVPTVRALGERLARGGAKLIRINAREEGVPRGQIGIASGAMDALRAILD